MTRKPKVPPNLGILPSERPGHPTPLTPYGDIWFCAFGKGEPPWGEMGRWLPALEKAHGPDIVLTAFKNYCGETLARFASVTRFAQTFGAWVPGSTHGTARSPLDARDDETADQYIARVSNKGSRA